MNVVKCQRTAKTVRFSRNALALALLVTLSAHAQDQVSADKNKDESKKEVTELNAVIVTGTHKAGLSPTDSISPIDVYSGAQIEDQAAVDLTDSLTKIMPALNTQRFPIADGTTFPSPWITTSSRSTTASV